MNIALKEWAVVLEALAAGRQLFLLRKGGIAEGKHGFELKHREFVFFPTWEHQHADSVKPEFRSLFEQLEPRDPDAIDIRYFGRVTDVLRAPPTVEAMQALSRRHIWTESFIQMRYRYRPDLPLFVVLVRIFRLPHTASIPADRRYAGCRSWVTLYNEVPAGSARPAVDDSAFESGRQAVLDELRVNLPTQFT